MKKPLMMFLILCSCQTIQERRQRIEFQPGYIIREIDGKKYVCHGREKAQELYQVLKECNSGRTSN